MEKSIRDKTSELKKVISDDGALTKLEEAAKEADKKRENVSNKLDELEDKLNAGKCSAELKAGLTEQRTNGKTYIDNYRALLRLPLPV